MITLDRPRDKDTHTIADFAELLCLITHDRICDRETLSDHFNDVSNISISDDGLTDCYAQLAWRATAFGPYYPFTLDAGERCLEAADDLSQKQEAYILLLLCANLPFIDNRLSITDYFEKISVKTLKKIWPNTGDVIAFGKNNTEFTGTKSDRINSLAENMGARGICDTDTFRKSDNGDGGIDLAAWAKLDNFEKRNIFSALAQCACSRSDWPKKQTSISAGRLVSYMHASSPWNEMLFIPHCFRDNNGRWAYTGEVASVILFDRLRILLNLEIDENWKRTDPPPVLDDFLNYRMALV